MKELQELINVKDAIQIIIYLKINILALLLKIVKVVMKIMENAKSV
jgi:hypothetical protein